MNYWWLGTWGTMSFLAYLSFFMAMTFVVERSLNEICQAKKFSMVKHNVAKKSGRVRSVGKGGFWILSKRHFHLLWPISLLEIFFFNKNWVC